MVSGMTPDALIARTARRQDGLVTIAQARAAGLGRSAVRHRIETGRWELARRTVYVIGGVPPSWIQTVLAVCLAAGSDVAASHRTAGALWGLGLPAPEAIEVVGRRIVLPGVRSHQSSTLAPADLVWLGPVPLTSPARTIVDCANQVSPRRLGHVVDDALRRGLTTARALEDSHRRVDTGPGRRPTLDLREILRERRTPGDSTREADLVAMLAAAGLPAPVLGHVVRLDGHEYRLDIAWPGLLVSLEYDSWEFHRSFSSFHEDRDRMRRLTAAGWTVLPVTSKANDEELVRQLVQIFAATEARSTAPSSQQRAS